MDKIEWNDWSAKVFERARREDKLVLLSISATWCHWCHVMDRTTFQDADVVQSIREGYVPIRIDTDRRPDINDRYNMGGWPSTVFLTPDGEIMWGTTYVPPADMRQLLGQFRTGFQKFRKKIYDEIHAREGKERELEEELGTDLVPLNVEPFRRTVNGIMFSFDAVNGGFGRAPKFPMPASIEVMMRGFYQTGGEDFLQVLVKTLDAIANQGMYDKVEGGFFRYATDESWTLPHYEKILMNNAQLIRLFFDAAALLGLEKYRDRARHALEYVLRTLTDRSHGVFFGSQEADEDYYSLKRSERESRAKPSVDRTLFTDWNAEMDVTLFKAWGFLGDVGCRQLAVTNLDGLCSKLWTAEGVRHVEQPQPSDPYLLRDHVALLRALLSAFEVTGQASYLWKADELAALTVQLFWDEEESGLGDRTSSKGDVGELKSPRKDIDENALAAEAFALLAAYLGDSNYRDRAVRIVTSFPDYQGQYGHMTAQYALAIDRLIGQPIELDLVVDGKPRSEALKRAAVAIYAPRKVIRILAPEKAQERGRDAKRVPAAYVCVNGSCLAVAATPDELVERLESLR